MSHHDYPPMGFKRMFALLCCTAFLLLIAAGCVSYTSDCTYGHSSVCEVHHAHMTRTNVPITYGILIMNPRWESLEAARPTTFPHAPDRISAGCIPGRETNAIVYLCPACVTARNTWEKDPSHP